MCDVELTLVDTDTGETIILMGDTDLTIVVETITLTTQQLRENRRYRVMISASNNGGQATSKVTISKLFWMQQLLGTIYTL